MKKPTMIQKTVSLVLAVSFALPAVFAHAGEQKLRTQQQLVNGLSYVNTITQDGAGRQESFAMTLEPDADAYPITVQSSGTIYGAATVAKAVAQAQGMGYNVLAAINSDYFVTSNGVPMGIVIENGIYKSSAGHFPAVAFADGAAYLVESPQVKTRLVNDTTGQTVTASHFNKQRVATGGLYLLNRDFSSVSTRTSGAGWMIRMEVLEGAMTVSGAMSLRVTELLETEGAVEIGANEYILTAARGSGYDEVYESYQVGDTVTLTNTSTDENLLNAQWATGTGDLMVNNGLLTDTSTWQHVNEGRAPRTALGVTSDGRTVFYVVDGRQSGYSTGLSQKELADEMIRQGCVWAVNLDGGGSSSLAVKTPGGSAAAVVNAPSDGTNRSCATYIVLVTDKGNGQVDHLGLKNDGLVVLSGSTVSLDSAVVLDNGGNTLSAAAGAVTYTSGGLGTFSGSTYTAGSAAGTDTVTLYSESLGITGTAQVHVVSALSAMTAREVGKSAEVTSLAMKTGEQVSLTATGTYWSRTALRDGGGVIWQVSPQSGGTITSSGVFTAGTENCTITATAGGVTKTIAVSLQEEFTDVPKTHWSYEAVKYCYDHGIVGGVTATKFGLGQNIRRGDFVLMLYRLAGEPNAGNTVTFTDVAAGDYYTTAISWAVNHGIAAGTGNGAFGAKESITREQAFTIINRTLPQLEVQVSAGALSLLDQFSDSGSITAYAREHIATLVAQGLVSGSGGRMNPQGKLTREEMAALLYKLDRFEPEEITDPGDGADAVTGITLNASDLSLEAGQRQQLAATLSPGGVSAQINWSSSDPSIATVTSDGVVENVLTGGEQRAAVITAAVGSVRASCTVLCDPDGGKAPPEEENPSAGGAGTGAETGRVAAATVVNASTGLNVRSGPGTGYDAIARVSNGASLDVLERLDGWCRVSGTSTEGLDVTGYVSSGYLEIYRLGTVTGAQAGLNLRTGPGTEHAVAAKLENGSEVIVLETLDGWYKVTAVVNGGSVTGYVSSTYVVVN